MDERIDVLEREVVAIKSDIALLKSTCQVREDARAFDARVGRVEAAIAELKVDVAQLKVDVAQLKIDVAQLKIDVAQLKIDVAQIKTEMSHLATKAELRELEARLKTWMITFAISLISVMSGIQFALYAALKN